jgi:hypothetical protein
MKKFNLIRHNAQEFAQLVTNYYNINAKRFVIISASPFAKSKNRRHIKFIIFAYTYFGYLNKSYSKYYNIFGKKIQYEICKIKKYSPFTKK